MPPLFLTLTYLHLFFSTALTALSRYHPFIPKTIISGFALFIAVIVCLFVLMRLNPGIFKYIVFGIMLVLIGQLYSFGDGITPDKDVIFKTLVMASGIFGGMTVLAFIDKGGFLGFGPYLFAGLIGLILARIGLTVYGGVKGITEESKTWDVLLSYVGVVLFAFYTAYDTQKLKEYGESLGRSGKPDYVRASLDLYLDILNLFVSVEDIVEY